MALPTAQVTGQARSKRRHGRAGGEHGGATSPQYDAVDDEAEALPASPMRAHELTDMGLDRRLQDAEKLMESVVKVGRDHRWTGKWAGQGGFVALCW